MKVKVSYTYIKNGALIFIEDYVGDEVMNTATNFLSLKHLYLKSKGLKSVTNWEIVEIEEEEVY